MADLEKLIREAARRLLADGTVELIIGYERGTLPLRTTPCFIGDPDNVGRLVWDASCANNLATYLHHTKGKVGIVAKGCDSRSIVSEIVERQIPREDVIILGVPCQGVMDRWKIEAHLDGRELLGGELRGDEVRLRGTGFEEALALQEVLCDGCRQCSHRNPPLYDILIGELVEEAGAPGEEDALQALAARNDGERWAHFSEEYGRCIRCYACREACPSCYCEVCFIDQTEPRWVGLGDDLSDVVAFHLIRTYHVAGRCLDCGACERACPMHIDLRTLQKNLQREVREAFGYEAGLELDKDPPLAWFRQDDPQEFIK